MASIGLPVFSVALSGFNRRGRRTMSEEYVGMIVMEVDSQEIDIVSIDIRTDLGRRVVKTMNRKGRAKGFTQGVPDYSLTVEVPIPKTGETDWEAITNAKITIYPQDGGGERESYHDCFTTSVGKKFEVEGESRRTIEMGALNRTDE